MGWRKAGILRRIGADLPRGLRGDCPWMLTDWSSNLEEEGRCMGATRAVPVLKRYCLAGAIQSVPGVFLDGSQRCARLRMIRNCRYGRYRYLTATRVALRKGLLTIPASPVNGPLLTGGCRSELGIVSRGQPRELATRKWGCPFFCTKAVGLFFQIFSASLRLGMSRVATSAGPSPGRRN